ncbi:MAG: peptide-methionine (S)-S-oxide reductase MsrA [Pseudomonadales bacterium]|nr:peptide-methionine (S)-S-oxide reductase MsrA [Pseudomonadales bacterium]
MLDKNSLVDPEQALPDRDQEMQVPELHHVLPATMKGPFPEGFEQAMFGLGCFWGAERAFWLAEGVHTTAVGYAGGFTKNPSYEEVCSGQTGHTEVVYVVYDPSKISYAELLTLFWENHNPTQGMRQGNDLGTQYRSAAYSYSPQQLELAQASKQHYQEKIAKKNFGQITTEVLPAPEFFYAEHYHQQYLAKVPNGYCGLGGVGIAYDES